MLINGTEKVGIKRLKNLKAFIDYSQTICIVYDNLEEYNSTKKRKVLIVFDDGDIKANKKISPIVSELTIRRKKINISFIFISQSYFKVPKTIIRLNKIGYFLLKHLKKRASVNSIECWV